MLECIRISKAGYVFIFFYRNTQGITIYIYIYNINNKLIRYPTRRPHDQFLKRYKLLVPKLINKNNTMKPKEYCEAIIKALGGNSDLYQFGLTKIFLRAGVLAKFEKMRTGTKYP